MSRAKLWCAAAVAVLFAAPGAAFAQDDEVADSMRADGWIDVRDMPPDTMYFYGQVINRAKFNNPIPQCDTVATAFDAITGGLFYSGNDSTQWASYFAVETVEGPDTVIVSAIILDRPLYAEPHAFVLRVLLHEAAHHAGYGHTGHFTAQQAERCAVLGPPLEEDDDDPGGGNTPRPQTCTETRVWVEPETITVFVKPEATDSGSGEPLPGCECVPTPVPGITIEVDSGYWTEKVIAEGRWKVVTECTEN